MYLIELFEGELNIVHSSKADGSETIVKRLPSLVDAKIWVDKQAAKYRNSYLLDREELSVSQSIATDSFEALDYAIQTEENLSRRDLLDLGLSY